MVTLSEITTTLTSDPVDDEEREKPMEIDESNAIVLSPLVEYDASLEMLIELPAAVMHALDNGERIPQCAEDLKSVVDMSITTVIQDTTLLLGDGCIPSITLVMRGNLLKGIKRSEIRKRLIIGIIVARLVGLHVIGIAIVKGAIRFSLVPHDPLYQFVLLLQYAVPPAINIATITQLFGSGENECSVIMLWSYVLASVALTGWSIFYMWLVA